MYAGVGRTRGALGTLRVTYVAFASRLDDEHDDAAFERTARVCLVIERRVTWRVERGAE